MWCIAESATTAQATVRRCFIRQIKAVNFSTFPAASELIVDAGRGSSGDRNIPTSIPGVPPSANSRVILVTADGF